MIMDEILGTSDVARESQLISSIVGDRLCFRGFLVALAVLFASANLAKAQCVSYLPTGDAQIITTFTSSVTGPGGTTNYGPETFTSPIELQAYPQQVGLDADTIFSQCGGQFPNASASVPGTSFQSVNGLVTLTVTATDNSCAGIK